MNSKFLKSIGCLAIALALTACSSEEMADGTQLPEGKYPITFTATGLEVTPVTRATADGTWTKNDKVAVNLGDDNRNTKNYEASTTDGNTATLKPADAKNTFYWQSTSDSYKVRAWIWKGGTEYSVFPAGFEVKSYQSNESAYQQSDFLYAHGTLSYTEKDKTLTFYHQTAKVVVHVLRGDDTPTGMTIDNLKTRELITAAYTWTAPTGDEHYGTIKPNETFDEKGSISPFAFTAEYITLPNGSKATPMMSYKFLIVPQTVNSGDPLFTITANGYGAPFIYTPTASMKWEAGNEYTYYITIKGSKVTATVSTSIGWTEGSAGAGSTEI